ncbi:MAG: PilZ domain-containing protein [Candidatus Zixiibacteriota bacterium]
MSITKRTSKGLPSTTTVDFEIRAPFKIMEENRRRFIRIDIGEPVSYQSIKSDDGFWPAGDGPSGEGEIINISAGGILMFTKQPLLESTILSMSLRLEGCETIDNILGKVKRVEIDSGGYLVGVESITREKLEDNMSQIELERLSTDLSSFTERLRNLLNNYIYSRKLNESNDA